MNPNPQMQPQMQPPTQQPGFFKRNWGWLLGGGCLSLFLCCGGFGAITYFAASSAIKTSGAYVQAIGQVVANPEVRAALGEPITPGLGIQGEIKDSNGVGTSDFSVPLSGPKGKGTLRVVAKKSGKGAMWSYSRLVVETESGKTIDLMAGGEGGKEPVDPIGDIEPDQVNLDALDQPLLGKQETWAPAKSCAESCERLVKCQVGAYTVAAECEESCDSAAEGGAEVVATFQCFAGATSCAVLEACDSAPR